MNGIHRIEALEHRTLLAATLVQDFGGAAYHGAPRELTAFDGHLYYVVAYRTLEGNPGVWGYLWRTDGTPAASEQVGPAPSPTLAAGAITDLVNWAANLQVYTGTWGVNVASERLWFYHVTHQTTQQLSVTLNSIDAQGTFRSYDLGTFNLSSGQNVNDVQDVEGRMYFFRDGDRAAPDPADRIGYWWTVNDAGDLVSTGVSDRSAFLGDGPDRATSAEFDGRRFFADEPPTRQTFGRELYAEPLSAGASSGITGRKTDIFWSGAAIGRSDNGLDDVLR